MNNRTRFFNILENKKVDRTPFFPDITSWYEGTRKEFGSPEIFGPGVFIPDGIDFHSRPSSLNANLSKMSFLDYYKEFDWGLPVHIYDWYSTYYTGGVEEKVTINTKTKDILFTTPKGDLTRNYVLDNDGSWAPHGYLVKEKKDFEVLKYIISNTHYKTHYDKFDAFLSATQGFGVCDAVIRRSPFGKLVHEYLGFQNTVFAIMDYEDFILDFIEIQAELDLKLIKLAADSPTDVVIISDHADENLISPPYFEKYCFPFYNTACDICHQNNKYVSTHLDGNIKSYLPIFKNTKLDLLDGCTPAPMFNYTPNELAQSIKGSKSTYLGVPSSLFITGHMSDSDIINFADDIIQAFDKQVILNIGDILPVNGDINHVIALGKHINSL